MSLAGNDLNEFRFPSVLRLYPQLITLKNDSHPVDRIDVPRGGLARLETGAMDSHPVSLSDLQFPYHRMTSRVAPIYMSANVTPAGRRPPRMRAWFALCDREASRGQPVSSFDPHQRPIRILGDTAILSRRVPIHPMLQRPACRSGHRRYNDAMSQRRLALTT